MKIGVVADTHSGEIPRELIEDFKKVDLIIHAGDFCSRAEFDRLAKIKEVKAVFGNMDEAELREMLPERQILEVDGLRIGLYHGCGAEQKVLSIVQKEFHKDKVDVVIFGHSHQPLNEKINGVLYFNPGSPNDQMFAPYCSYGILEIKDKNVTGRIIKIKDS